MQYLYYYYYLFIQFKPPKYSIIAIAILLSAKPCTGICNLYECNSGFCLLWLLFTVLQIYLASKCMKKKYSAFMLNWSLNATVKKNVKLSQIILRLIFLTLLDSGGLIRKMYHSVRLDCHAISILHVAYWCEYDLPKSHKINILPWIILFYSQRSHLQDLKDVTHNIHYETYRVRRLNECNINLSELGLSTWLQEKGTADKFESESHLWSLSTSFSQHPPEKC